jgi:CRISPR-associated protein Csx14
MTRARTEVAVAEASIPVDLLNPGQVFACIGVVEAAEILLGNAEGAFDWSDPSDVRFRIRAAGDTPPVCAVLEFLDRAEARAQAVEGSPAFVRWNKSWGPRPSVIARERGYPFPDPSTPATFVCVLSDGTHTIALDHWGDATARDNVKFWAGAGGYPGAALARDALDLVRGRATAARDAPFSFSARQSSSFRLDWRRDYIPLDAGFSLNAHSDIEPLGYPIVELLAVIGLSHARPYRPDPRDKLVYQYAVIGRDRDDKVWFGPGILRAALGGAPFPFPMRRFRMLLGWPGKEGQARSITTISEETIA